MKKTMLSTKQSYLVCFIGILAAFGIVMALCESGLADSYIKGIMMTACIAIIMTTSLNLTIGVLGQLTLGCCGFEAIGAYVAALTSKYMVAAGIAIDPTARFLLTTLIGGVVACVFGILIGIPALRLHGDYLAIITLGFGEIIRVIIQNLKVAGGMGLDKGAAGQALIGIERTANLYVVFWIMVVTVVVLFMFGRSRYGRAVKAIRDDEIAAGASGLNTTYLKVLVFAIFRVLRGHRRRYLRPVHRLAQPHHGRLAQLHQLRDHGGVRRHGFAHRLDRLRHRPDHPARAAARLRRLPYARLLGGAGARHDLPPAGHLRILGVLTAASGQPHAVLRRRRQGRETRGQRQAA